MAFGIGRLLKKLVGISSSKKAAPSRPAAPATIPTKGVGGTAQAQAEALFAGFVGDLDETFVRLGRGRDFRAGVTSKVNALGVTLGS